MTNKLFYGDNYEVLQNHIQDESVDLVYIDPPFNSKRNYNQIYNNIGTEDKAQAQAFVDTWSWDRAAERALREILGNEKCNLTAQVIHLIEGLDKVLGKSSLFAYLLSMTQRINELHRVLKPTGSFYLHCDPTASHYLKLICDALFCTRGGEFRNEIIWHYRRWTNKQTQFQKMHDVVLFYSKSKETTFNILDGEPSISQIKKFNKGWDQNVIKENHKSITQWIVYDRAKFEAKINPKETDKIVYRETSNLKVASPDVFIMPIINSQAKERLGYPTQKPEALLERIIKASSNEGDTILDCYCGCGTTVAVAQRLNRKWIGIDITYQSISLIIKRLEDTFGTENININPSPLKKVGSGIIHLAGIPQDLNAAKALANKKDDRLRKEFEKWAVLTYSNNRAIINEKKGSDKGIDGIAFMMESANTTSQILFSVKSGAVGVKEIRDLRGVIEREKAGIGIFITLEEPTKPMIDEARQAGIHRNKLTGMEFDKIQIVTIQKMLNGERLKLPLALDVVKSAVRDWTSSNKQKNILNEEERYE